MPSGVTWTQVYDPTGHWWLSTLIAALPIVVLLGLLAGFKVRAHLCAIAGAVTMFGAAVHLLFSPWLLLVAVGIFAWIKFRPSRVRR